MAEKFSQQIASSNQQQASQPTRTERQREEIEKRKFETARAEAERLQKDVFVDKTVTEKYFVTERYRDRFGRWRERQVEKTRDVNDPFTEEEYAQEYSKLSPDVQQFLASPTDIQTARTERINQSISQANAQISTWQSFIDAKNKRIEEIREKLRDIRDPERRRSYKDRIDELRDDIKEYEAKINYFQREFGKIEQGYDWRDLKNLAEDRVRASEERRQQQRQFQQRLREDPNAVAIYSTENRRDSSRKIVGFLDQKKSELPDFLRKQKVLTQRDISYYKTLSDWSKKGFDKLPEWAKKKVNPDLYKWQKENPDEKLIFNERGEVAKIQSAKYGRVVEIKEYESLPVTEFEKANPDEKLLKRDDGTVYAVDSKVFGGTYSIEEYQKKVEEYNKNIKTPEQQAKEYQESLDKKPIYTDDYVIEKSKSSWTESSDSMALFLKGLKNFGNWALTPFKETAKEGVEVAKEYKKNIYDPIPDIQIKVPVNLPTDLFFATKERKPNITLEELKINTGDYLAKQQQKLIEKETTRKGIKQELDTKYQEEYQTRFERAYGTKIILGQIDFETASKEFQASKEAEIVARKYEKEYNARRGGKFTLEGAGVFGLGLGKAGLTLVPTTVKGAVVEGALIYTGYNLLKATPPLILNTATFGFGVKGTFDALSPTKLPEQKFGGLVTAGLSFGTLGYQAYKWARTPTVRTEKIVLDSAYPKEFQRGKVLPIKRGITFTGEDIRLYKASKFSEQIISGRRTIVSTKFRDLLGIRPVYEGVPTMQLGKTYVFKDIPFGAGDYVFKTRSGYERAFDLLTKRGGYTPLQARQTLRYIYPKVNYATYNANILLRQGINLEKPIVQIKGIRDITQPKITIDEKLGIKTKGGKTIREYISGEGEFLGKTKAGEDIFLTKYDIQRAFLNKNNLAYTRIKDAGKLNKVFEQLSLSAKQRAGFLDIYKKENPIIISKKTYQYDLYSDKAYLKEILRNDKFRFSFGKDETILFKRNVPTIDIRDLGLRVEILNAPKKTSELSATIIKKIQEKDRLRAFVNGVTKDLGGKAVISTTKTPNLSKSGQELIAKINEVTNVNQVSTVKTTFSPLMSVNKSLKDIIKVITGKGSTLASSSFTATASTQTVRNAQATKTRFKLDESVAQAQLVKQLQGITQAQSTAQAQDNASSTRNAIDQVIINPPAFDIVEPINIETPTIIRTPKLPKVIFGFGGDDALLKKKILERKQKNKKDIYALLPDFTARALGLKPQELSLEELNKATRKVQTGFEIRTGARLKRYSAVNEKTLMKGIMK